MGIFEGVVGVGRVDGSIILEFLEYWDSTILPSFFRACARRGVSG